MAELWIKFTDEDGVYHRVAIDKDVFRIGRASSCDLVVPNSKLSREHVVIQRSGEQFIISDRGSSNGTELNNGLLLEPTEIMNGDRADLGGGLTIEFELSWDGPSAHASAPSASAGGGLQVPEAALTAHLPPAGLPAAGSENGFPI